MTVKAMILAAGMGQRMLQLTKDTPKPLLMAGNKPLIQYQVESLVSAKVYEILINTGRLGEKIQAFLGDGTQYGANIRYSHEGDKPLGTGGGVQKALAGRGDTPFRLGNGEIWTDFDYSCLQLEEEKLAHIILVENPAHPIDGDFALDNSCVYEKGENMLTYSGIGIFRCGLFLREQVPMVSYIPALRQAIRQNKVCGEHYNGLWIDIGTPQRLTELNAMLNHL